MASSSLSPPYKVFVSYAEEDKATVAFPLREQLLKHGITAFVDEKDIPGGSWSEEATNLAMKSADIAVIVLSPEYVARKSSMKELLCFLRRTEKPLDDERSLSVIIPLYYRLSEKELPDEPRFDRFDRNGKSLYGVSRFLERMEGREPEASFAKIKASLRKIRDAVGVSNYVEASNDSDSIMLKRRSVLLKDICEHVQEALKRLPNQILPDTREPQDKTVGGENFRSHYHQEDDVSDLVLDFWEADRGENATSIEADVLPVILDSSGGKSVTSIQGIGGVGKTSILRGLSSLDVVKQRFHGGTYLISLGSDATRSGLMEALCKLIQESGGGKKADDMRKEDNWKEVFKGFRSWFAEKECLFMVDDVWETSEITSAVVHELSKLHLFGMKSKVLITTRSTQIASRAENCFVLQPREPQDSQCRAILMLHSRTEVSESSAEDERAVIEILRICSGLPLFLKLAGSAVKALSLTGSFAYHRYARTLEVSMQGLLNIDIDSYDRLASSLSVSVNLLEDRKDRWGFPVRLSAAEMHRRLSVLLRQSRVPMSMLRHLWELRSEAEATIVARGFEQVALASVHVKEANSEYVELLEVHDSLYEYALGETEKHGEETLGHKIVLEGYGKGLERDEGCRAWWSKRLEADGYIHRHLCRHLKLAERRDELVKLLLNPEWTIRSTEESRIPDLEKDYGLGLTVLEKLDDDLPGDQDQLEGRMNGNELSTALQMISEGTRLSCGFNLGSPRELCFQLHGRLISCAEENAAILQYLRRLQVSAAKLWRPWLKPLSSFLLSPGGATMRIRHVGAEIFCMTITHDGRLVFCGCGYGIIVVVDVRSCEIVKQWRAHKVPVLSLAFSKDRGLLLSGSAQGEVKVWDTETGDLLRTFDRDMLKTFQCHGKLSSLLAIGDGQRFLTGFADGTVYVRDLKSGRMLLEPIRVGNECHKYSASMCLGELPGEEHFLSGCDRRSRIWNATSGQQSGGAFEGHSGPVNCVSAMPDGRHIVSGADDNTVRIWNIEKRNQEGRPFKGHFAAVRCVAVSKDGRRVVSGSADTTIRVWDVGSGGAVSKALKGHTSTITEVLLHPVDNSLISCSCDGTLRVWDLRKIRVDGTFDQRTPVQSVAFTSDGRYMVFGCLDYSVQIWDLNTREQVGRPLVGHSHVVTDVAVTPDGRRVLSVSRDTTFRVWAFESQELLHTFDGHINLIDSIALRPSGDQAVTSSRDGAIRVWNLVMGESGHFVLNPDAESRRLTIVEELLGGTKVFVTDDGLRVVAVNNDEFTVWNLETRHRIKILEARDKFDTHPLRLSRRTVMDIVGENTWETSIASVSLSGQEIWYERGEECILLGTLEARIRCWAFSPERKLLCAGLQPDGRLAFMKLET